MTGGCRGGYFGGFCLIGYFEGFLGGLGGNGFLTLFGIGGLLGGPGCLCAGGTFWPFGL